MILLFTLSIPVTLKFQKTKSDALVLIKLCLQVTFNNLISFIGVFLPFLYSHGLWSFLGMFAFVCFAMLLLLLFLLSLVFISRQTFISNSKDTAGTTAVIELIIRKTTVSLLLTLTFVYYSRELLVQ